MRKMLIAVRHEYLLNIRQKGFLLAIFSLPLFICLSVGFGLIMDSQENNSAPVGYVDFSGVFEHQIDFQNLPTSEETEFILFEDEAQAQDSLMDKKIQAFIVIPKEYFEQREFDLVYLEEPGENAIGDFYDFLQLNILSSFEPEIRERVARGTNAVFRTPDGVREFPDNQPSVSIFLPLIISFGFAMLLVISSGYLMSGFLEDKANRTIELIITSLSPAQFVSSKLFTMVAIGLTMLVTWIVVAVVAIFIGGSMLNLPWIQGLVLDLRDVLTVVVIALPSYIFAAAIMLAIGLIIGDKQEAESVGPLLFVVAFLPLWMLVPISNDINGPLAVGLSFIPITSQITVGIRSMLIQVPIWQVVVSVVIQTLFVLGALWLAVRTFRIGILRTGKRIRWHELFDGGNEFDKAASR
jgi:ABC-2 type transport system permease protein